MLATVLFLQLLDPVLISVICVLQLSYFWYTTSYYC